MQPRANDQPRAARHWPPPYVRYATFLEALDRLRDSSLEQIRLGLWFSPTIASRLAVALRYLGLATDELEPTLELRALLRETLPESRERLRRIITARFDWVFDLPTG